MADHFYSLPSAGHAICSMPIAASRAFLLVEPADIAPPYNAAEGARHQYATVSWALGPAFSVAAVTALPKPARNFLARTLGVAF
jgi:hypothetical protein